ncbi:molybdenum cofactor sulfurase [Arthroderma uncinatum]|uniref:molybdenum cofactor sulfurase n=1 Tax=Arthroderma uncinatum TaxID=74035 RepID=UPI00144AC226|nr:molybdenum cofactor sulfurase [Arthroderma uncinatum]KAF3484217.1 molybdenum cofactor sulfurase [Arthroderma uncinatum]
MGSCISRQLPEDRESRRPRLLAKWRQRRALKKAERTFRRASPTFGQTSEIDTLRATEYTPLKDHIYLDYTGAGLYGEKQLRTHFDLLRSSIYSDSQSTSSAAAVEQVRAHILSFFRASPDEYEVIFTANASHALKLVGEAYPFTPEGELLLLWDNHNSVQGLREFARGKGVSVTYAPVTSPGLQADEAFLKKAIYTKGTGSPRLFAYPAQSNFSGVQHSLEWIEIAQAQGWDVVLDAASFVPANVLDLSRWHPDFVPISFYKMFGYPSGIGCLIARKQALSKLQRPWVSGEKIPTTIQDQGSNDRNSQVMTQKWHEVFEDGSIDFFGLPAIEIGLNHLSSIGMETIHNRVILLAGWLIDRLLELRHSNGRRAVILYGPQNTERRGGTISFNFIDPNGRVIDERIVDQRAIPINLSLRTGCFCNPGAGEAAFHLTEQALLSAFHQEAAAKDQDGDPKTFDEFLIDMGMSTGGGVRISLGLMTNFADVFRFLQFAHTFIDDFPAATNLKARLHC